MEKGDLTMPFKGPNHVGAQGGSLDARGFPIGNAWDKFVNEGGVLSRILNVVPGINAVAGLHDVFQVDLEQYGSPIARNLLNVPGMIPAATITYAALMDGPSGVALRIDRIRPERHPQ